jgi:hypothetical protein
MQKSTVTATLAAIEAYLETHRASMKRGPKLQ